MSRRVVTGRGVFGFSVQAVALGDAACAEKTICTENARLGRHCW
jgi:hypothetical protein